MKYCFGPVPSRRLGLSLGIDILPLKTCNLDCIYCELGPSPSTTCRRKEYVPADEIKSEIRQVFEKGISHDVVTFSASGETTLHSRLGELIRFTKRYSSKPVVIITNGTTLHDRDVRHDLHAANIVMPSLDAATERTFRKINRPASGVKVQDVIKGLKRFREEFNGVIWLEILLVKGINDNKDDIDALKDAVSEINPHKIQLNTVHRPPAETWAKPLSRERLEDIQRIFGEKAEVIAKFHQERWEKPKLLLESEIRETLARRPLSIEDIEEIMGGSSEKLKKTIKTMEQRGEIIPVTIDGTKYFKLP